MKKINSEIWVPADGMTLEPNALKIAKESANSLVVAGPGAGKTELLAQKACYLLQTNTCRFPYRILAISFKRDAAYNLKERVRLRCDDELSRRFDSLTFDSFAKQLLDRFKQALPDEYRITDNYDVVLSDKYVFDLYESEDVNYFNTTNRPQMLSFHTAQFPYANHTKREQVRYRVWDKMIKASPSQLSFKMIMRLAEYIINANPKLKQYLHETYEYVFLDEFQDTTGIQYDLFKSCFLGSKSHFTAVGDDKQRIMLWAGAHHSVFKDFVADTTAERIPLKMNFRCAPRLVSLLNHLTKNLLGKSDMAIASPKWRPEQGECSVWFFDNPDVEKQVLFQDIQNWILTEQLNPRDICILVKQQLEQYAGNLIAYFNQNGIKARDENRLQDILTQELSEFIIYTLYNVFDKSDSTSRKKAFDFLGNIYAEFEDQALLRLDAQFSLFIKKTRSDYKGVLSENDIANIIIKIIAFAGKNRIRSSFAIYKTLAVLDAVIKDLQEELIKNYKIASDFLLALDMLVGKDTIPVMTIHKSKGLEYHTVIFIGLEDGAFWSFKKQEDEDKCAFFVALSRAKERVVFTFSGKRETRFGMRDQSNEQIRVLFDELQKSGVVTMKKR
jgi:superfamily I DNA/RNA helicase